MAQLKHNYKTASVLWDCSSWVGAPSYTPLGGRGRILKTINVENGLPESAYYRWLFIAVYSMPSIYRLRSGLSF